MRVCQSLTSLLGVTLQLPLLGRACPTRGGNSSAPPPEGLAVTLEGYGTFTGMKVNRSYSGYELPTAVDAWLGMAYAEQPVGARRFTEVSWPAAFAGARPATAYGPACVQDGPPDQAQDEACLSFNVYRTPGVPLSQKLPVLVWIHGGAFVQGSWHSFDGAAFAASAPAPLVVVSFHYRLNSLGFLPSPLFAAEGLLNLGLRDQYFFLRHFVQRHIGAFGGDAAAVTIGGRSAGGHSVGFHYYHNYGADEGRPYFAGAIHQSGAATSRAFPDANYPLYAEQFANFTAALGCDDGTTAPAAAVLDCLRAADIDAIRNVSTRLFDDSEYYVTWPFQPTRGGPLLEKAGSQSAADGTFFRVPVLTSNTNDEGKFFVPGDLATDADFRHYLHTGSPALTAAELDTLASLYPDPATDPASPYAGSPNSTQYNRVAAAWSDYAYICPGQDTAVRSALVGGGSTANVSSAPAPVWKLRFATNNSFPAWQGIPHTADAAYTWDERAAVQHPDVSPIYHGYLASFATVGDPNPLRHPGSPFWPRYEVQGHDWAAAPGRQLVVEDGNRTRVEWDAIRTEQCRFWRDPERAGRLNK